MNDWRKKLGTTFLVRVIPKASCNKLIVEESLEGTISLRLYVTAAPQDGKANEAVIKLLAKELGVTKASMRIIRGLKSRDKTIEIPSRTSS